MIICRVILVVYAKSGCLLGLLDFIACVGFFFDLSCAMPRDRIYRVA
uniref:Uncharacterized protein n=1 Tax=Arundo donax TaxID=35708 RepID=A0A0A8YGY4_ARUDO